MIIGITGTLGAGKGTVVEYLVDKYHFLHISARLVWTLELEKRDLPVNRDSMTLLANQLRAEYGPAYFVQEALGSVIDTEDVVIESIRTVAEAELLKSAGGVLLAVDADQKVRYQRICGRASALDNVTYEEFARQEKTEMASEDMNKQNVARVIKMADYTILNTNTPAELQTAVDAFLKQIL